MRLARHSGIATMGASADQAYPVTGEGDDRESIGGCVPTLAGQPPRPLPPALTGPVPPPRPSLRAGASAGTTMSSQPGANAHRRRGRAWEAPWTISSYPLRPASIVLVPRSTLAARSRAVETRQGHTLKGFHLRN